MPGGVVYEFICLRAALRAIGAVRRFRPGASAERLAEVEERLGFPLAEEVRLLLGEADGMEFGEATLGQIWFFQEFYLLSSEEIVDYTPGCVAWLRRNVVPLLGDGAGTFFVVLEETGEVFYFDREEADENRQFLFTTRGVAELLYTIRSAMEVGCITLEPDQYLAADDKRLRALGAEINGEVSFWRSDLGPWA